MSFSDRRYTPAKLPLPQPSPCRGSSMLKGHLKSFFRKSMLKLNETLATRLLTSHVGSLCHK